MNWKALVCINSIDASAFIKTFYHLRRFTIDPHHYLDLLYVAEVFQIILIIDYVKMVIVLINNWVF